MHIHIISRGYPTRAYPLNGIFEFDQAEALSQAGHKVVVVALDFRSIRRWRKFGLYKNMKNNINIFHVSIPLGNIEIPFFNLIARKIVSISCQLLRKYYGKPDVIHSHFLQISSLATEIKKQMGVPLVITEHSSQLNVDILSEQFYNLARITYKQADLIVTVSESLQKRLLTHFNIFSKVVPNIVSLKTYFKGNHSVNHTNDYFTFISVGTLNYNKGFDLLLQAFKNAKFSKQVKLKIIGEGEMRKTITKDINSLGLQGSVELLGFQPRSQIFKSFKESEAFVLASRGETFGVVFIEAMLSGLPVIATKCGGPEDLINEANGILVDLNDVNKLSDALVFMVNNRVKYNSSEISQNAIDRFSPQVIAEKLTGLYKQILTQAGNQL